MISIKLRCNFIEIAIRCGSSPVNLLHISRTPFPRNTYGGLLLNFTKHFYKVLVRLLMVAEELILLIFKLGIDLGNLEIRQIKFLLQQIFDIKNRLIFMFFSQSQRKCKSQKMAVLNVPFSSKCNNMCISLKILMK